MQTPTFRFRFGVILVKIRSAVVVDREKAVVAKFLGVTVTRKMMKLAVFFK